MKFNRVWAMPSAHTFTIYPIAELVHRYVGNGIGWIDPFAGENSPAEFTNDHNPEKPTKYHMEASDFVNLFSDGYFMGALFVKVRDKQGKNGVRITRPDGVVIFRPNEYYENF